MQLVPLAAKMVEERPLLGDIKDVEEDASRNKREISKEAEEKENRVGRRRSLGTGQPRHSEQASGSEGGDISQDQGALGLQELEAGACHHLEVTCAT